MNIKNPYIISLLILVLLANNFQCNAQDESINYDSLAAMPLKDILKLKVTGVSKYEEVSEKSPASVIIITESQIRENCYHDLSDVLKNVLAVDVVDNARGFGEYYTIRGVEGNDRFLVTIDGQKINPVSGTFLSVGNSISVKFAERIEIIFGPASVMYGADAFSGIINIVTKDAVNKLNLSANADYGSMNTINSEIAAQFITKNKINVSAFARFYHSNGPDFIGRDTIYDLITQYKSPQRNQFEQPINDHTIFIKTKYKDFTLSFFRQGFSEGNALGLDVNSYIYNKENKWALSNNLLWATYEKDVDEKSKISINLAYVNHTQDPETQFYKWYKDSLLEKSYSQYMTGIDNTLRGSMSYTRKFLKKTTIITGLEYEYTNSIPPYANDQLFARSDKYEGNTAVGIKNELTINEQRLALFSQLKYSIFRNLDFVFGGRYDYSKQNKETFNPRLSIVYSPINSTTIKFLYGTAFQAPSLFYQYEQWGSSTAVMLSTSEISGANPALKLENQEVETYEVNANYRLNENLVFHLSAYNSRLTNLIERIVFTDSAYNKYFSTPDSASYSIGIKNINIGNQKISGINFKAELNFKADFYSYLSYSFTNAYAEKDGGRENIPRIAKHKFWCGLIYRNLFDHLNISTRVKWIGKINNRNEVVFPAGTQPGYLNMDLSLRATNFSKPVVFYIRLENIFNNQYSHVGVLDQVVYLPSIPQSGFVGRFGVEIALNK